jgi:hypothetical protein
MAIEDYAVSAFVSGQANYESVKAAVHELIDMINDDDETNEMIKQITIQRDKSNGWTVYAIMNNNKAFKYAIYIDSEGRREADGF